ELVPVLAEKRPEIEKTKEGGMIITFRIRKEARWDNGSPVSAKDVEFTVKAMLNPGVNNPGLKSTIDFISDIRLYPDDPQKVSFVCNTVYFLSESACGSLLILPQYQYDPKGLMNSFTVPQLIREGNTLHTDARIQEFASDMNSEKRMRDKRFISGSGAYQLVEWKSSQYLLLKKKADFWGQVCSGQNCYFDNLPAEIEYKTIGDLSAAAAAFKAGNLDVIYAIRPKDFMALRENTSSPSRLSLQTPPMLACYYIGMNNRSKILGSRKTRQAMACLADVNKMIQTVYYGLALPLSGPVPPSDKADYDSTLPAHAFSLEKAKALLADDGWKDTDGDGILDKVIDGEKISFRIRFTVSAENELRKSIALLFQEDARKAGIEVTLDGQEWNSFMGNLKKHRVELFINALTLSPLGDDMKQIWHSSAASGEGDNYVNFCNPAADSLIDAIRVELDGGKRALLYKKFQQIIYRECPCIFLFAPSERIAIASDIINPSSSVLSPGFWTAGFQKN
ncbi:MAG TPA: ABC transporter substrate-binding protein, partial [Bacteroidia bacterium]|nr:ABC transporter substrate-binding protein [Bacteroidia bacterium]